MSKQSSPSKDGRLPVFTIGMLCIVCTLLGIICMPFFSLRYAPPVRNDEIFVSFEWPGIPAEIVEKEATIYFESAFATIAGIRKIRSVSSGGRGVIRLEMSDLASAGRIRHEVAARIRQVHKRFPPEMSYPSIASASEEMDGKEVVLSYILRANRRPAEIHNYGERFIAARLLEIKGVRQVDTEGGGKTRIEIRYDPGKLRFYHLMTSDIALAITDYFRTYELGQVREDTEDGKGHNYISLQMDHAGQVDWSKVPVGRSGGRNLFLTDLARCYNTDETPDSYHRINGENAVSISIMAGPEANYLTLAPHIKKEMAAISAKLPDGYSISLELDAQRLQEGLLRFSIRTLIAVAGVSLFLWSLLRTAAYPMVVSTILLVSLCSASIFYYFFKVNIHLISIAGISVSTGMIIANSVAVVDHLRNRKGIGVLTAVGGATMTSIAMVGGIFFLDKEQKDQLTDFSWIVVINMIVSFVVISVLLPALRTSFPVLFDKKRSSFKRLRTLWRWNARYEVVIAACHRYRYIIFPVLLLLFGLPVYLLPDRIESARPLAKFYNNTIGSQHYNMKIKPWVDKMLGGLSYLFISDIQKFAANGGVANESSIAINIRLPFGATMEEANNIVLDFESFLSNFRQVSKYTCNVKSARSAQMRIFFTPGAGKSAFPHLLKRHLEEKAIHTGLAEFSIYGVGPLFSDELEKEPQHFLLRLTGYDYDRLCRLSEQVKGKLQAIPRVTEISVRNFSEGSRNEENDQYIFRMKRLGHMITRQQVNMMDRSLSRLSNGPYYAGHVTKDGQRQDIVILPASPVPSVWNVRHQPLPVDSSTYVTLDGVADMERVSNGDRIAREDQQYALEIAYDFLGNLLVGSKVSPRIIAATSELFPLGFRMEIVSGNYWQQGGRSFTRLIMIILLIIFVIGSVLLNSVKASLSMIAMMPLSFIGVFIAVHFLHYQFDEGGYAALVVVSGKIAGNVMLLLYDQRRMLKELPDIRPLQSFVKTYDSRIVAIICGNAALMIGLIPFAIYAVNEPFWYAFAMTSISALLFSLPVITIFLPLFSIQIRSVKTRKW